MKSRYITTNCLCTSLMGIYWMGSAFILSFASAFLLHHGLNNTEIGIILASGSVLSILFQSFPAYLADKYKQISVKSIMILFSCSEMILIVIWLIQSTLPKELLIPCYTLLIAFDMAIYPFINSFIMEWENAGISLKYSFIRSFGSASYGVSTMLLGILSSKYGLQYMMPILCVFRLVNLCLILLLKNPTNEHGPEMPSESSPFTTSATYAEFFREYKHIVLLLSGFFFLWISGITANLLSGLILDHFGVNSMLIFCLCCTCCGFFSSFMYQDCNFSPANSKQQKRYIIPDYQFVF